MPGGSCGHSSWTGDLDRGVVVPVKPARASGGAAPPRTATRRSGPSSSFREGIKKSSLLSMPGDEDDEDEEDIYYVNALGVRSPAFEPDTLPCPPPP